jgi:cytochrome c553
MEVILEGLLMIDRCWLVILACSALICTLSGCGKQGSDSQPSRDPIVLFDVHCSKCHAQAGEPGGPKIGGSKGPSLAHIGSESGRNAEWIANYIRDPKSVRENSRMPKFGGELKEDEIRTLAEYLAERK